MNISIEEDDITEAEVDAIVNPANSYGYMGGGVAGAIKKEGGMEIEKEATSKAPIMMGFAVITTAGKLKAKHIIHAPTMEQPASLTTIDNIKEAVKAALECAEENNLKKIAMPGMGTGVGEVPKDEAAKAIIEVLVNHNPKSLKEVILIDKDEDMVTEFEKVLGQ
ncbi:MAG: macro domain-containing protein [Candidatus Woesearchaeota archaeon]|jgi:O-acetyl-ADP-ribose deacetylase (regulator of RNase III)|nr:macro domain-containing protein [Candidatus Woesearchaeota archaeon]